jgi:DNA polymerase-3 subunit gamma/tau
MNAVVAGASDEMMRIADRLMTEGQSPAHFARQLVRFLRNAVMARVAGAESPLLQISTDERARVNRVAGQFSEEELTRFLQIMLRTHADVSYRQEQRFHLELGLLKLVHAQRLLPVEELLSGMSVQAQGTRPASGGAPPAPARPPVASQPATPRSSPFDTDRARKSFSSSPATEAAPTQNPAQKKMSAGSEVVSSTPITIGATAAVALEAVAAPVAETEEAPHELASVPTEGLRLAITAALEGQGQRAAAAKLDESEWVLSGNELAIRVPLSDKMTEVVVNPDARRIAQAEASRAAGRPLKVKITGGGTAQDRPQSQPIAAGNGSTDSNARSRASQDPVVQRMQEKFGAEVRTVIDQRNRK